MVTRHAKALLRLMTSRRVCGAPQITNGRSSEKSIAKGFVRLVNWINGRRPLLARRRLRKSSFLLGREELEHHLIVARLMALMAQRTAEHSVG